MNPTEEVRVSRKRAALRLFFYGFIPFSLVAACLLLWNALVGTVPESAVLVVYVFCAICALVCLVAVARFYIAHFSREPKTT